MWLEKGLVQSPFTRRARSDCAEGISSWRETIVSPCSVLLRSRSQVRICLMVELSMNFKMKKEELTRKCFCFFISNITPHVAHSLPSSAVHSEVSSLFPCSRSFSVFLHPVRGNVKDKLQSWAFQKLFDLTFQITL